MDATPSYVSAIVQLEIGDVVTFSTLGQSASSPAIFSYSVSGLLNSTGAIAPGNAPATYVEGFILKEN